MRFKDVKDFVERRPALSLGLATFLLYLPWLGAADLATDEAKSALNIAYPHPPLVRWMMAASQTLFGANNFAVRLPGVLWGAVGVAVMFLLLERLFGNRKTALTGATILALLPAWATFARSGYLSTALATCALVMLLGIARLSERHDDPWGHRLLFIGLAIGLWCELQAVLLIPVWAWWMWRNRVTLKGSPRALTYAALGGAQIVAFGLYILSSPQILADTFSFARSAGGTVTGAAHVPFLDWFASLSGYLVISVVILLILNFWLRPKQIRQPEGLAIVLQAGLFIVLFLARATDYYAPYLVAVAIPLAALLSTRLDPRFARAAGITIAVICLFLLPFAYVVLPWQTFYRRNAGEFALALKGEHGVIVLGDTSVGIEGGYALQFYLPVPVTSWPEDTNRRISRTVLVLHPETLTETQKTILRGLQFDRLIGPVAVYRIP